MIVGGHVIESLSVDDALQGRYGQIIMGMLDTLLADDDEIATCFVNTTDFDVSDGGWNPSAWDEFIDVLEELDERFGADVVNLVVEVDAGFGPTDEATWPDDGIAATFYDDFTKLFGVDRATYDDEEW